MHAHKIAHRDAGYLNLMMDASKVIPRGFHPIKTRTHDGVTLGQECHDRWSVGPVKYYFIDFGLSRYYPDGPWETRTGLCGQDRTVPELVANEPYDPFKLDIFQLGNAFMEILMNYDGLDLLLPLIKAMTCANPKDRPSPSRALQMLASFDTETLSQCVSQFPTWEPWRRPNGSFEEDLAFLAAQSQAAEKDANLHI
ncbi:hypothetical protein C0992_009262 [Termitomyces sp. T32_za158]|nr:hypothetical protein C0992_009262 [Termitomyces sp. T32_za158]